MPKVVPKNKLPAAAVAALAETAAVDNIEVPPLPPIAAVDVDDTNNDEAVKPAAAPEETGVDDNNDNSVQQETPTSSFYAVRVGYAAHTNSTYISIIRSAIFLKWEDVQPFVEFTQPPPVLAATTQPVDYMKCSSMEEALRYIQHTSPQTQAVATAAQEADSNNSHPPPLQKSPNKTFNPPTKKWENMYQAALLYKSTHGHLDILNPAAPIITEQEKELLKWVKYQRSCYKAYLEDPLGNNRSMTSSKVYRLKEAGFDWIVEDENKWLASGGGNTNSSGKLPPQLPRKRGRPKKDDTSSTNKKKLKSNNSTNPEKKTRPIRQKWLDMLTTLQNFQTTHGHLTIPPDSPEHSELASWLKTQKSNYLRWKSGALDIGMTQEKVNLLTQLGVEFDPSWEEMLNQVLVFKRQHGHIQVREEDHPQLASWMSKQNHVLGRHLAGFTTRLSKEQIGQLVSLGFEGGRRKFVTGETGDGSGGGGGSNFDVRWDEMFGLLQEYKSQNGHCNVPSSEGTKLANWVAAQRRMYGKLISGKPGKRSFLDASKMQRLTELGFQFRPRGSYFSWEENIAELKKFVEENGDCKVPVNHERLGSFVKMVRREHKNYLQGKKSGMTAVKEAELQALGFVFEGGKTPIRRVSQPKSWEERYQDLIRYKEENGDTIVPQNSGRLGAWVHAQRVHYKRFKNGEKSQMTAEKALKLSEIGFCFDAGDRFRGTRTPRQPEADPMQVPIVHDVPPTLGGSFY